MRLTLRTMLAYMDGILEADDAEDIGKKIEESEYAKGLLQRTRDVMRRLRLSAPQVTDRGPGLDANTVAEYLDNTLDHARVPDFERVCLESDVHLAEVASCHQILTLVLGEAAEIDPVARQRMYQLPDLEAAMAEPVGATPPPLQAPGDGRSGGPPVLVKSRPKPTVPDYLREPPRKLGRWSVVGLVVMVACLAGVLLLVSGQFGPGGLLHRSAHEDLATNTEAGQTGTHQATDTGEPAVPPTKPKEDPSNAVTEPAEGVDSGQPKQSASEKPDSSLETAPQPPDHQPVEPAPPTKEEPASKAKTEPVKIPVVEPTEQPKVESPPDTTADPAGDPAKAVAGAFVSDGKEILLEFDPESSAWQRVRTDAKLRSGRPLLALPAYRPRISLGTGIALQLIGDTQTDLSQPGRVGEPKQSPSLVGTQVELLPRNEEGLVGLKVEYGQLSVTPLAQAGTRLRLVLGDRHGVVTFAEPQSTLAVEVVPARAAGSDPETEPRLTIAHLYVRSERVIWEEKAVPQTVTLEPGQRLTLGEVALAAPIKLKEFPKWVSADTVGPLDRQASAVVNQTVAFDRPAELTLLELANHRKREVKWLAQRCLGYLGQFEPMVAVLDDANRKTDWPDYIAELRAAVTRNAKLASAVREALEKKYPREGKDLYRMLWGYTLDELKDGEARTLVEYLDHQSLAPRVLSFWNLKEITGWGLLYRPEDVSAKRKRPVKEWNDRLATGEIWARPATAPKTAAGDPAATAKPSTPDAPMQGDEGAATPKPVSIEEKPVPADSPPPGSEKPKVEPEKVPTATGDGAAKDGTAHDAPGGSPSSDNPLR